MANPTPRQILVRDQIESLIGLAAPLLDVMLAAGDRLARAVEPESEYYAVRPAEERLELPTGAPRGDAGA